METTEIIENLTTAAHGIKENLDNTSKAETIITASIYAVGTSLALILQNIERKLDET